MKKVLLTALVIAMCLSTFVSCSNLQGDGSASDSPSVTTPSATTPDASTPTGSIPTESSSDAPTIEMPPQLNLDREMTIFVGELHYEEWLDADDGDIVNTELYNRIPRVEDNLGIDLSTNRINGIGQFRSEVVAEIVKYTETTDPNMTVDLCSCYSWWAGSMTIEGRYMNVADSDYIDLYKPYWPIDIVEGSMIDGKVYTVSGDISPTLLWETYCIFFNVDLLDKYNIDNPIDLVISRDWTIDKLIEITKDIYSDDDTSVTGPNLGDTFGFTFNDEQHLKPLAFGFGLRVLEPDEEKGYVLSELYTGEKADKAVSKLRDWINNNNGICIGGKTPGVGYGTAFMQNQAIFTLGNFAFTKYYLADKGVDYGVVPCPLYDKDQEEYYSYYGNPSAFWGVPCNVRSLDDSCALLEALAADAYIYISPAIFERALKHKYIPGDLSGQSRMFDIIRSGLVFDPCMTYNEIVSKYQRWEEISKGVGSWSAMFTTFAIKQYDVQINRIVSSIRNLTY